MVRQLVSIRNCTTMPSTRCYSAPIQGGPGEFIVIGLLVGRCSKAIKRSMTEASSYVSASDGKLREVTNRARGHFPIHFAAGGSRPFALMA